MTEYNYAYTKIQEFAEAILLPYRNDGVQSMKKVGIGFERHNLELREMFSEFLMDVANSMELLEKADSGDIHEDVAFEAIEELMFGNLDMLEEQGLLGGDDESVCEEEADSNTSNAVV